MLRVCVFCGSKSGDRAEYAESAEQLGHWLARGGHTLIYGGGSTGMMGLLAEAVLAALQRRGVQLFAYSTGDKADAVTQRQRRSVTGILLPGDNPSGAAAPNPATLDSATQH